MSKYTLTKGHLETVNFKLSQISELAIPQKSPSPSPLPDTRQFTDAPTVEELKALIPLIFMKRKPLCQYFSQELFLAQNLRCLSDHFSRLNYRKCNSATLPKLITEVSKLQLRLDSQLQQLIDQYSVIHRSISLQILSNVRTFKNLNNSRIMINGLLSFKYMFQNFAAVLSDLDGSIMEINDLIDEWNREPEPGGDIPRLSLYDINNKINGLSDDRFETVITKVLSIFDHYVETYFDSVLSNDETFDYEVVSI